MSALARALALPGLSFLVPAGGMKFISNYFVRFSIMAGLYQYNGLPKGKNAFTGECPWLATPPESLEQMRFYAQDKNVRIFVELCL